MDFSSFVQVDPESGCHVWIGTPYVEGYGRWKNRYAHRFLYEEVHGSLSRDMDVHHKCGNKSCVNLEHLVALSHAEHMKAHRPTHCRKGHLLSDENVYVTPSTGARSCRVCMREGVRRRKGYKGIHNRDKTHCKHGHPFSGDNLRIAPNGDRLCRECKRRISRDHGNRKRRALGVPERGPRLRKSPDLGEVAPVSVVEQFDGVGAETPNSSTA